jgi:uncharacterized membrane protein
MRRFGGRGEGIVLGAVLGIIGCSRALTANTTRTRLVKALETPDFMMALLEDLVTIGGSLWVVSRF